MLFKICIYALHMANLLCLLNIWPYFLWLILRIVVHGEPFLRTIEPLSARPFNFPKEFHLTEAEVNQNRYLLFLFCTLYCHFNFRLSFIGSRSEWSLPHWGGTQNSEVRVLHRKQQSFVSSAYSVYSEYLTATADDHMNKWTGSGLFISSGWSGDFTLLLHSGYVLELIQIHNWIYRMCWIVDVTENCLIASKTNAHWFLFYIYCMILLFDLLMSNVFVDHFKILFCNKFSFLLRKHSGNCIFSHTNKVQK